MIKESLGDEEESLNDNMPIDMIELDIKNIQNVLWEYSTDNACGCAIIGVDKYEIESFRNK